MFPSTLIKSKKRQPKNTYLTERTQFTEQEVDIFIELQRNLTNLDRHQQVCQLHLRTTSLRGRSVISGFTNRIANFQLRHQRPYFNL